MFMIDINLLFIPKNVSHTHLPCDSADTIINITLRRTETLGGNTSGFLDSFKSPVEFSNNLSIGLSGQRRVRPSMNTKMMTVVQTTLGSSRVSSDVGTNVLHGWLDYVYVDIQLQLTKRVDFWLVLAKKL